jgi:aldose 1-epimerase
MQDRIALGAGALRVEVAARVGGSIARFDRMEGGRRSALFRGSDRAYDDVLEAGCFPLVPFANRIRGGRFVCGGRAIRLAPNMAGDPSPLHGQGWRGVWRPLGAASATCVELAFEHAAGQWPWAYEARQRIELDAEGLSVRLSCRNLSAEPMPCGLGLHPYFPCTPRTELDTTVTGAWTVDAQVLPVEQVPAGGRYDLRGRLICGQGLDNGFEGWSGEARIAWPERDLALQLSSPDAARFQVYSPAQGGVFVAEPVQNANAALNRPAAEWADAGLRMLRRDEEAVLRARFACLTQS